MSPPRRILFLNQFFWPDMAPTGVLLEDLARTLVERGCEVTVMCGAASYAGNRTDSAPPVNIIRMPSIPYSRNPIGRLVSWVLFLIWALIRSLFGARFDLIVTMTSPPGLLFIGAAVKLLRGIPFWVWEMDLYPDVAIALGAIRADSIADRILGGALYALRHRADGIVVLGTCMRDRLQRRGLDASKLHVAENWATGTLPLASAIPQSMPIVIRYSGNLGLAHETETIAQVMLHFRNRGDFRFVFAGGGARRAELEEFCARHSIGNAEFVPYLDDAAYRASLSECHLGLVTLRLECLGTVVPSKTYAFLSAGRAFLYIGPGEGTIGGIAAEGCGWQCDPGDVQGTVALLERLRNDLRAVSEAGFRARAVFEERYSVSKGTRHLADVLLICAAE